MANRWSSQFGFIMATVGAAVGLGNIWKFPYMAGQHGGGAFMLLYIGLVFLVGVPALLAEMLIGRYARCNQVDAMHNIAAEFNQPQAWRFVGWWGALALIMILSFYSVLAGWSIGYLWRTVDGELIGLSPNGIADVWWRFIANPWELLLWHSLFMAFTVGVVMKGVSNGIEEASKTMMPLLFLILIVLVIYGSQTAGFAQAVDFLFFPDWSAVTSSVVISALGQAAFSLAIGAGAMLVYGSYTDEHASIAGPALVITIVNIVIAMLVGLAIFPIVFTHELPTAGGPNLMYNILPIAFSDLPYGQWLGCGFFSLLFFAALTSSISMLEPLVVMTIERTKLTRRQAALILGFLAWVLGISTILSFNLWSGVRIFGQWSILDITTDVPTNIIIPTGSLLFAIFVGWVMPTTLTRQVLGIQSSLWFYLWRFLIRWIVPVAIAVIFVSVLMEW